MFTYVQFKPIQTFRMYNQMVLLQIILGFWQFQNYSNTTAKMDFISYSLNTDLKWNTIFNLNILGSIHAELSNRKDACA